MRGLLAIIFLYGFSAVAFSDPQFSVGSGFELRSATDVNPQNVNALGLLQLYGSMAFHPWSMLLQIDIQLSPEKSGIGNYSVSSQSINAMLWGRYEPWQDLPWSPYAGVGVGQELSQIKTQFGTASDSRWTDGGLEAGLCAGVMTSLWQHWNIEGEAQMFKQEFAENLGFGLAIRTGYTF